MTFRAGAYYYEIVSEGQENSYCVTDGKETISEPILYAFGNAQVAQTYVYRRNGKLHEGRVSYYTAIDGLDWTIGDALNPAPSLEEAATLVAMKRGIVSVATAPPRWSTPSFNWID
jgi:hypothetical protein